MAAIRLRIGPIPHSPTLYHPHHLPPTRTIVDTPKGTLRDMSRPGRNTIRIATKTESSAVIKKDTKPAKAGRTLELVFGKRFTRKVRRAQSSRTIFVLGNLISA